MKKFSYFIYVAALTCALFTISCNKNDDDDSQPKKKQVSALVYNYDGAIADSILFIYDTNDLLIKVEVYELISSSKKLAYSLEFGYTNNNVTSIFSYYWDGTTKVAEDKDSISYDKTNKIEKIFDFDIENGKFIKNEGFTVVSYGTNNLPSRYTDTPTEYTELEYAGNNVSKTTDYLDYLVDYTATYTYDDKKNPFKGNPFFIVDNDYYNTNNYVSCIDTYGTENVSFEYNREGYPTKATVTSTSNDPKKVGSIYLDATRLRNPSHKKNAGSTSTAIIKIYYK